MSNETVPIEMPFGNYALEGLSEITLPDPLPILPLAPAWKYVFIVVAIWLTYVAIKKMVYWLNNRYRQQALDALVDIEAKGASVQSISAIGQLLKGTSLYVFSREKVASLTGKDWLVLLNEQANQSIFNQDSQTLLGSNLYKPVDHEIPIHHFQALIVQVKTWLSVHPYTGVKPLVKPIKLATFNRLRGQKNV